MAQSNAATYGERIKNEITDGIEITDTLEQVIISENGEFHQFDTIAENLMSDSIESMQLAPNGIVADIYPAEGNEAGKIDLLHDKDRKEISCYARDNHTIITQGPFELKQGGYGIAVRNPVYLKDKRGQEYFWGFTIVILRVPDIFSDAITALSNFGYEYKILKTATPWSDDYKVVYQSDDQINHPVSYTFTVRDENWKFEVTPKVGWRNNTLLIIISGMFLTISLLLSVLTRVWLVAKEHQNKYQILARSDSLTNIYNRYGFNELAEKMIHKNPNAHFVAALLDIDDFKFINDIYGHSYGDRTLKILADSMKAFFHLMHYLEEMVVMNSAFFYQIVPLKGQMYNYSNSPNSQKYSHIIMRNMHFIFLLDMQNIQHWHPAIHSSCAVQMLLFMK